MNCHEVRNGYPNGEGYERDGNRIDRKLDFSGGENNAGERNDCRRLGKWEVIREAPCQTMRIHHAEPCPQGDAEKGLEERERKASKNDCRYEDIAHDKR